MRAARRWRRSSSSDACERGVELHVVQGQADLAGQLGEHPVVLLGERLAVRRRARRRSARAARPSGRSGATRIGRPSRPASSSAARPRATRRRDTPARATTGSSVSPTEQPRRRRARGTDGGPLVVSRRTRSRPRPPRAPCVLRSDSDELEQQLVQRHRAGEAAAERAQRLVGRVPLAVDEAVGESVSHRGPAGRAARRRPAATIDRSSSVRSSSVGRAAEPEHDRRRRRRRPRGEPGERDGVGEQAVDPRPTSLTRRAGRRGRAARAASASATATATTWSGQLDSTAQGGDDEHDLGRRPRAPSRTTACAGGRRRRRSRSGRATCESPTADGAPPRARSASQAMSRPRSASSSQADARRRRRSRRSRPALRAARAGARRAGRGAGGGRRRAAAQRPCAPGHGQLGDAPVSESCVTSGGRQRSRTAADSAADEHEDAEAARAAGGRAAPRPATAHSSDEQRPAHQLDGESAPAAATARPRDAASATDATTARQRPRARRARTRACARTATAVVLGRASSAVGRRRVAVRRAIASRAAVVDHAAVLHPHDPLGGVGDAAGRG